MSFNPSECIMELSPRPRVINSNVTDQSVKLGPHDKGAVLQLGQSVDFVSSDGLNRDIQQLPVTGGCQVV